jgi:hypothetical protein
MAIVAKPTVYGSFLSAFKSICETRFALCFNHGDGPHNAHRVNILQRQEIYRQARPSGALDAMLSISAAITDNSHLICLLCANDARSSSHGLSATFAPATNTVICSFRWI